MRNQTLGAVTTIICLLVTAELTLWPAGGVSCDTVSRDNSGVPIKLVSSPTAEQPMLPDRHCNKHGPAILFAVSSTSLLFGSFASDRALQKSFRSEAADCRTLLSCTVLKQSLIQPGRVDYCQRSGGLSNDQNFQGFFNDLAY